MPRREPPANGNETQVSSETQGDLLLSAPAEARPWQPRSGMQLGSYRLEKPLGVGAFAAVWRVQHIVLGSGHALKIIMANTSSRLRERVVRKAKIQATIQNPNVANVQDVFSTDAGRLVLVMELIEGPKHPGTAGASCVSLSTKDSGDTAILSETRPYFNN